MTDTPEVGEIVLDGGCQFGHWVKFTLKRSAGAPYSRGQAPAVRAPSSPPLWIPAFAGMTN